MNETLESSRRKISNQKRQDWFATNSDESSRFRVVPCRQREREPFTTSGLIPSEEISIKPVPSFQFFAMSEHGLNLCVDLNSNLSEWIDSIKGDVRICTEGQDPKSRNTSNYTRGLAYNNEHIKIPSTGAGMKLSNGVKRKSEYNNSPSSFVASENYHSDACEPDPTVATYRASMLTSTGKAVDNLGGPDGNLVASSSCITHSGFRNQMAFEQGAVSPQDSASAPRCTEIINVSVSDASLKSFGCVSAVSHTGIVNPDQTNHYPRLATTDSGNLGVNALDSTPITVPEKNNLWMTEMDNVRSVAADNGHYGK